MKIAAALLFAAGASAQAEFDASASLLASGAEAFGDGQVYSRRQAVSIPIPHLRANVELDLKANLALFSPDWYAETYDPQDGTRSIERNVEKYQCHYKGPVKGYPGSVAALSICDGMGMRGEILIPDLAHVEVYPSDTNERLINALGMHIVQNATKKTALEHGEPQQPVDDGLAPAGAGNDAHLQQAGCSNTCVYAFDGDCDDGGPGSDYSCCDFGTDCGDCGDRGSSQTYMNDGVFATDIYRVNRLGSNGDLQQTQSLINRAQAIYTNNNNSWRSPNPNHRIAVQPQAPAGWNQQCVGSGSDYLTRCRTYYNNEHRSRDNIQCLQEGCPNSALGWGYMNAMCGSSSAGWTRMLINDDRENADTIAHEMGHNYGFDHENGRVCMGSGADPWFGPQSHNRWEQVRNNYSCLR